MWEQGAESMVEALFASNRVHSQLINGLGSIGFIEKPPQPRGNLSSVYQRALVFGFRFGGL